MKGSLGRKALRLFFGSLILLIKGVARGLGLIILFLGLLICIFYFSLKPLVHADSVRSLLAAKIQELVRRPVEIENVVLSPSGLKVQGVRVSDRPGISGGPFLVSEFAVVTVKLLPLFSRRLELGDVRLVSPRVHLVREDDGEWNVSDLLESDERPPDARGRFSLPFALGASQTVIEDGSVHVEDKPNRREFRVRRLNLSLEGFGADQDFPFAVSFDNTLELVQHRISASWSLEGTLNLAGFDFSKAQLRGGKLKAVIDGQQIRGSLSAEGWLPNLLEFDLRTPSLGPSQWRRYFPQAEPFFLPQARWRGRVSWIEPRKIHVETLDVGAPPLVVRASGLADWNPALPHVTTRVNAAEFPLQEVGRLWPKAAVYRLKGWAKGSVSLSASPGRLDLHNVDVSVRQAEGSFKKAQLLGGDARLSARDDFARASLRISRAKAKGWDNTFDNGSLSATIAGGNLEVDALSVSWGRSRLNLRGKVVGINEPRSVQLAGRLDRLNIEDLRRLIAGVSTSASAREAKPAQPEAKRPWLRAFKYTIPKKFPDSVGHILVDRISHPNFECRNLDIAWDLRGISPTLKKVSGKFKVGFGPGRVTDIPQVQKSHVALKVVFLPFVYMHKMNNLSVLSTNTAYPKTLDFSRIEGEYGLAGGVATMRYFYVDSSQLVAYADGSADFGRETVNMNILTRLTAYRAALPEWWVDELGRPAIGFRVKGNINDPELEPRLRKMAGDEIEKLKAEGVARAQAHYRAAEKL